MLVGTDVLGGPPALKTTRATIGRPYNLLDISTILCYNNLRKAVEI